MGEGAGVMHDEANNEPNNEPYNEPYNEPFKELIDGAPDGVVILEAGRIMYLNATAARLLGVSAEDALGRPLAGLLPPGDAALAGQRIGRLIATGEEMAPNEYRALADPTRVVEIKAKRWQWQGRPAVLAFARDVTERKALQQQLMETDRLAAIGSLAASVAHEVNNPLTYVQLSLESIELALQAEPAMRQLVTEQLQDAHHGVARVAAITQTLRAFARTHDAPPVPVDLVAVVDRALKMVDNDLRHRARLVRSIADVPWVIANAARLQQVLVNLLLNSIQALCGRDDDTISVEVAARSPDEVAVTVRDTGRGMSADVREHMFDPFFTTRPGEGMGLGLSVSRTIVTAIGGRIEVDTREGEGTTITVVLRADQGAHAIAPATHAPSAATHAPSPATHAPSPGAQAAAAEHAEQPRRRVLIVDDEQLVRNLLAELVGMHHDVVAVDGGAAALAALAAREFDVVLCDVMMPGLTGVEVCKQAAERRAGDEKRFVFITGGAFMPEVEQWLARCGNPVLAKPFQIEAVLAAIANVALH